MSKTTLSKIKHIVENDRRKSGADLADIHDQRPAENTQGPETPTPPRSSSLWTPSSGSPALPPPSLLAPSIATAERTTSDIKTLDPPPHARQAPVRHPAIASNPMGSFPSMSRGALYTQKAKRPPEKKTHITAAAIADLYEVEGQLTMRELSERYGIPSSTLYRWAKKTGYRAKNGTPPSPISDETAQMIRRDLDRMTTTELAERYAVPYHVLYHWLRKEHLSARKVSRFPASIQEELRERCRTSSLKDLALEYGLSQQAMRRQLQDIGCFSDGKGGFFVVDGEMAGEIFACYQQRGMEETARMSCTTKTAIQSFLRRYRLNRPDLLHQ